MFLLYNKFIQLQLRYFIMEKYFDMLKENGADLAIKIAADTIVTAAWTVYRCKYGCDTYGKSHCCPPNCPTWKETQEMINCFQYGILFRCHEMNIVTPLAVKVALPCSVRIDL